MIEEERALRGDATRAVGARNAGVFQEFVKAPLRSRAPRRWSPIRTELYFLRYFRDAGYPEQRLDLEKALAMQTPRSKILFFGIPCGLSQLRAFED
jgi:hypothetical protein